MKRYIKLPSRKTEYRLKNGFSLAEAMVMLVVIAILLAVSAPLIAKKANADQRRLVVQGLASSVVTALGGAQNFGIGTNNPQSKLHVNGNARIDGNTFNFNSNRAGDIADADKTPIFSITPGLRAANPDGFKVFADGTTNISGCMPDYSNMEEITSKPDVTYSSGANFYNNALTAENDGYVISTRSIMIYYNDASHYIMFHNNIYPQLSKSGSTYSLTYKYIGYNMVPVTKGTKYIPYIYNSNITVEAGGGIPNNLYFVPCKK